MTSPETEPIYQHSLPTSLNSKKKKVWKSNAFLISLCSIWVCICGIALNTDNIRTRYSWHFHCHSRLHSNVTPSKASLTTQHTHPQAHSSPIPWFPTFLTPGTSFMEDSFSKDRGWGGVGGIVSGWFKCISFAVHFYFYYYCISSTWDHQAFDPWCWESQHYPFCITIICNYQRITLLLFYLPLPRHHLLEGKPWEKVSQEAQWPSTLNRIWQETGTQYACVEWSPGFKGTSGTKDAHMLWDNFPESSNKRGGGGCRLEEFLAHSENILQASERKQGPHNFDENKWGW